MTPRALYDLQEYMRYDNENKQEMLVSKCIICHKIPHVIDIDEYIVATRLQFRSDEARVAS